MKTQILAAALLAAFTVPALSVELVPPQDLGRTVFDGKPITSSDARGRTSEMAFAEGGKLTRKTSAGRVTEGVWRLSDDGFCMKLGDAKRESCYLVLKGNDGKLMAVKHSGQPFTWTR
jgi:YD repeat-containing protein